MGFLEKLETFINSLLIRFGELLLRLVPTPVKKFFAEFDSWVMRGKIFFKTLPGKTVVWLKNFVAKTKTSALSYDYKSALTKTFEQAIQQYKEKSPKGISKAKAIMLAPFLVVAQWLQGLSSSQALLLVTFSSLSFLAVIGIGFSGKKLLSHSGDDDGRNPASVSDEIAYERPEYYKKQTRFLEVTSLRLPIYIGTINEIRSVDIDFTATLSNRYARMFLSKHEFQLRDHLILQIEPSVASFPLEEEGKAIIRKKLMSEINDFLRANEIEGTVTELKITYVLAN